MKEIILSKKCRSEANWILECGSVQYWERRTYERVYLCALHEAMAMRCIPLEQRRAFVRRFTEHRHIAMRLIIGQLEYLAGSIEFAPHCVWRSNEYGTLRAKIRPYAGYSNLWDCAAAIAVQHIREEARIPCRVEDEEDSFLDWWGNW